MHVCIVTRPDLIPTNHGAAVKIVETANAFRRLGHGCSVVTSNRDAYWIVTEQLEWMSKPFSPRVRAMEEWPLLAGGERRAQWFCRWIGYPVEEYFLYASQFDLAWLLRLVAVGLQEKVDVFQAEFPGYGLVAHLASRIVQSLRGVSVRSSIVQHNVEWLRLADFGHQTQRIKQMERLALGLVDQVIAVSQDDKSLMVEMGIHSSKISIVPHGVDVQSIQKGIARRDFWRKKWDVEDKTVVFFHGTLHYAPNTDAVRFIAEHLIPLVDQDPLFENLHFVIVGLNPPRYYEHSRITFTDVVNDLAGHLQMADLFLCPLFAGGGTRLKLLEYLAVGRPILTTRKGAEGILDLGQFTYVETASEMVEALRELFTQQDFAMSKSRQTLAQRLDWTEIGTCYVDIYQHPLQFRDHDFFRGLLMSSSKKVDESEFLSSYTPVKDRTLLLLINRGCNLTCSFCDLWDNPQNMELEQLLPVLDDAVVIGTKILVITGGEPLMHPELATVISEANRRGLSVNMTTNGLLLKRHWSWLKTSGIASLSFSLDGIGEIHDRLRGQKGAYERTLKSIQLVKSESDIPCSVYCTVTNQNVHQLWELYQICRNMGVGFDFWPVNDAPDLYIVEAKHQQMWTEAVTAIIKDNPIYASRTGFYRDSLRYHQGLTIDNIRCLGFVEQYGVTYEGNFLPCCVWGGKGLVKGNVFETPLRELWVSDSIHLCRKDMVQQGCAVGCFNHSLYEYRQATHSDS